MKNFTVCLTATLSPEGREVRETVFVREQGYVEEFDEKDEFSRHAVLRLDGAVVGAGRAYCKDASKFVVGRLAILKPFRGCGAGKAILTALEADCASHGGTSVTLLAQLHAVPFYQKCGYVTTGETADEEGHPHAFLTKLL